MFNYLMIGVIIIAILMFVAAIIMPDKMSSFFETTDIYSIIGVVIGIVICTVIWPVILAKNLYDILCGI